MLAKAPCKLLSTLNQPLHHVHDEDTPSARKRSHLFGLLLSPSVRDLVVVDSPGRAKSNVLGTECQFVGRIHACYCCTDARQSCA
jgi:hypothetical protein